MSELKYGTEKSTTFLRSSVIEISRERQIVVLGLAGDQRVPRHIHGLDLVEPDTVGDVRREAILVAVLDRLRRVAVPPSGRGQVYFDRQLAGLGGGEASNLALFP